MSSPIELKEARIVMQNGLAHATRIAIHNASIGDPRPVTPEEVVKIAKILAAEVFKLGVK